MPCPSRKSTLAIWTRLAERYAEEIEITNHEIADALREPVVSIVIVVKCLERTQPELADLLERRHDGGWCKPTRLARGVSSRTGLPFESPATR